MSVIQRLFPTRRQELEGLFQNYVRGNTNVKLASLEKCIKKVSASDMVNLIQTVVDDLRRTVLHKASLLGETKLVDCILAAVPMEKREIVLSMGDMEGSTALLLAASEGHEEVVECIMFIFNYQERAKRSSLLKIKNDVGDTALSCAAYHGYEKVVVPIVTKVSPADRKELLQLENDKGNTALHIAAQGGYTSTVKNLLAGLSHDDLTSFVRNCNDAGETVVFAAAVGGHTETVRYLREDSCTWKEILMIPNKKQETVVYRVASNGNIETLEELLTPFQAADIKRELLMLDRTDGDNVLFCLASRGHSKTLQYVLESVDPHRRFNMLNARNKNGKTVAHIAAGVGHTETIKVMIETLMVTQKFDLLSLRDSDNQNVLACASRKDQAACVGYMLTALDPDQRLQLLQRRNGGGHGILHSVAAKGFSNTMKAILESVTDEVDSVTFRRRYELLLEGNDSGSCPLREAILVPHLETTQTALNMLDLETRNNLLRQTYLDDETILHWVARSDSSEMLDYILQVFSSLSNEERSNILKLQNIDGNTALATAASRGYADIILGMVHSIDDDLGYDLLQLANNKGQTALYLAATKGHLSMTHSVLDTLPSAKLSGHKLCAVKGLKERREELIRARRSSTEKVQQYKSESRDLSDSFSMYDSAALQSKRQAAMEQYETQVKEQEKIQEEISSELNDCMELLYELDPGYRPEEADAVDDSELLDSELSSNCCEARPDQRSTEGEPQNLPGTEQAEKLYRDNNFIYLPYTHPIPELPKDILPAPVESEDLQKPPVKTNVKTTLEAGEETKHKLIELEGLKVEAKVLEEERKTAAEERRSLKEKQKECVDSKGKELYQTQIDNQERKLETLAQELNGCKTKIIQLETELHGWMPEIRQKPVTMPCTEYESIQDLPIFTAFSLSQEGKKEIDTSHSQNVGDATIESSKENITGENDIHQHQKSAAENEVLPPQSMENNSSIRDVVHPDSKYIYSTYDEVPIPDMSKDILPAAAETHDIKKSTTNIKTQLTAQEETKDITQQKLLAMYTEQTSPLSTVGEHITEAADNDSSAAAAKREHPHTQEKEHKRKEKAEVQADNQYIYSTYDEVPIPGVSKDILPAPETHDNKIPTTNIKSLLARGKKTRYVIQRKLVRLTVKKSKLEKRRRKIAKESQLWKEKLKNCLEDCDVGTDHEKHTGEATVAQCQSKIEELELKQEVTNVKIYHLEKEMKDVRLELDELQTADGAEQAVDEDDEVTDDMLPDDIEIQAYGLGVQPDDPYDELYLSTSSLESDTTTTDLVPAVNIVQNIQPRLEDKIDNNLLAPSGACTEVDVTPETAEHDSTLNDNKTENMEPRIKDTIQNILVPQTAVVDPECNARQTTHRHNTDVDALDRVSHLRTEYEVQIRKLKDECTRIADELQSVKQQQTTNADMRDNSTLHDKIIELERKQQTTNVQLEEFAEKIREIETATKEAAPPQSEEGEIQECNEQQIHGGVSQQVHGGVSQQLLVVEPPPDEVDIEGHIEQQEHGPRATYIVSLWRKTEEESLWYC